MTDEARQHVLESPLEEWPGSIELPHPNDFSGTHWQAWRKSVEKPLRKSYSLIHLYCYAGLELIKAHGEWALEPPLGEVQAWETDPDAERIKLVAWLGRALQKYMEEIIDPKG